MEPTTKTTLPSIKSVSADAWQKLFQKKIYFGHQSVGLDIINGIKDIIKENPQIKLNVVEPKNASDFAVPLFAHSGIGKNEEPTSKIYDFVNIINEKLGDKIQVAFFKFCYVDVVPSTNVDQLFNDYRSRLSALKEKHPGIVFIHWTVPLTTIQIGPKAWIKKIIDRPLGGHNNNIKREQFNTMLRREYSGKEPIFDLAALESTNPDGTRHFFTQNGSIAYALVPSYTNDGGHLNEQGRRIVAEQLLIFLANLLEK